jgi:hypothetical protein
MYSRELEFTRAAKGPFLVAATATLVLLLGAGVVFAQGEASPQPRKVPVGQAEDPVRQAAARRQEQLKTLDQFEVFHEFNFRDRQPESGITFQHQITADSGRSYKPNHYDHGNGVAVADVDGDQRLDLYFVSQLGGNELWRNLGGGRFENITERAGVALADRVGASASFADVDNDGDADLYVTTVRFGNVLFLNDGKGRFEDVTATAGLAYSGHSSGALFFDYDRDGWLDLFLTNVGSYTTDEVGPGGYYIGLGYLPGQQSDAFSGHLTPARSEHSVLYRNLGAGPGGPRFEDVSAKTGLTDPSWSGDAGAADLNRDGYPDLYVLNMQGDDHYYENQDGQRFVDKTAELFKRTPWGSMGIKFFDQNNDGRLDLILTDMHSDMSKDIGVADEKLKSDMQWPDDFLQGGADNVFGNAFYRQGEDGSFEEISDALGAENYWPWGLSTGDLNADGWEDVFITSSMNFPFRYGVNSLLLNNRGKRLLDSEYLLGVEPRRGGRALKPWFVMDCDGADSEGPRCRGRSGRFELHGTLGSRSSAIFDLDDDGDLDIVTNDFNSEPMVLISDLSDRTPIRFLKVALTGSRSNRDALGALVRVTAGGATYTKVNDGQSGYLSHSRMPLYFGLGSATAIERVEIEWPSGVRTSLDEGLELNSTLTVSEPSGEASKETS